ncbi:MAG: hypothetical protein IJK90_05075 [Bacteroidales bacterium]|nr:hypothetical protein [Bacteroidales bacterium]
MMDSMFEVLPFEEYEPRERREAAECITEAMEVLTRYAANYGAALDMMSRAGIKHRLNDETLLGRETVEVLAGLQTLKLYFTNG